MGAYVCEPLTMMVNSPEDKRGLKKARMSLSELIFKSGVSMRSPGLWRALDDLKNTDFSSRDEFSAIKIGKFNKLAEFARRNSYFYRELWRIHGAPEKISSVDSLCKFPIVDKRILTANAFRIQSRVRGERHLLAETSGTTGQGLKFYRNATWDIMNRASIFRGCAWYGILPWERNGYLWGYNINFGKAMKTGMLDSLQNRFRLFSYDEHAVMAFIEKLKKARYLHGYSSMIYETARLAGKAGYLPKDFPNLKLIKGTAERIYPFYQDEVVRVFGSKIISEYGAAEAGIIAFECPEGSMHINEENVIVEEAEGEIVVTNLNSLSFPIIRYKLGDAITLDRSSECPCGRKSGIIKEVLGRIGKVIYGKNKKYPSLTLYYIFKDLAIDHGVEIQYQAYQREKGVLEIRFPEKTDSRKRELIKGKAMSVFAGDMELYLHDGITIHKKDGKLTDFITELDR